MIQVDLSGEPGRRMESASNGGLKINRRQDVDGWWLSYSAWSLAVGLAGLTTAWLMGRGIIEFLKRPTGPDWSSVSLWA